jgi:hypothetical protein
MISANTLNAQQTIQGTLVSSENNSPLAFAKIKVLGENRGAISNEDGAFELKNLMASDSLRISHYSVASRTVSVQYFLEQDTLVFSKRFQEINAIEITASKGALLELFDIARIKIDRSDAVDSKSYFSLESSEEGTPVELIEAYYQAKTRGGRIEDLVLKNGRIGMSSLDNEYFVSLSTTQFLQDYNLHKAAGSKFPQNPLMLSLRKIKNLYNYTVTSINDGILTVEFTPKKAINRGALFPSKVYLDKANERITRVEFAKDDLRTHPFKEINPSDTIRRLDFFVAYSFSEDEASRLERIELDYRMDYESKTGMKNMQSNGILLFHDTRSAFSLPLYPESVKLFSDYDKIVSQPYNEFFWSTNEAISPSEKKETYKRYFETHGVLLNFNELSTINPKVFAERIVPWSTDRIQLYQMNDQKAFSLASNQAKDFQNKVLLSDLYELSGFIYVDRNTHGDSVNLEVHTLINLEESFYYLQRTPRTVCFLNIYYDLIEIHRRKLSEKLHSLKPSAIEIEEIYAASQLELADVLRTYLKTVERGENEAALEEYIQRVEKALGIDNSFLILSEEEWSKIDPANKIPDPIIQRYNYGSALISIGRYKDALTVLLEAEAQGDGHPWLLYNIGLCYLKLGAPDLACPYFKRSEGAGERLEQEIKDTCADF